MTSTRASALLLAQCFVLATLCSCSDSGTGGSPASAGTGGTGSTVGGGGGFQATGGVAGAAGATTTTGGNTATGSTGSSGTGGAWTNGGTTATGGTLAGGALNSGGSAPVGGTTSGGGMSASGGAAELGGTAPSGGSSTTGGRGFGGRGGQSSGGTSAGGGTSPGGGTSSGGGTASAGGTTSATGGSTGSGDCTFTVKQSVSSKIATVGIVEWSTTLSNLSSANVVYTLGNAGADILNKGGSAPADVTQTNKRTLLLGLKPSSTYTLHIEATGSSGSCTSPDYELTTGALSGAPSITRTMSKASASAKGFIVTCTGQIGGGFGGGGGGSNSAYIIDADGTIVWHAAAPTECARALMDWEGANMWMVALNATNSNGEMRYVSMDGETGQNNISGLSAAHHDITVAPGGIVAAMVWASGGSDPESNLIERSPSGTLTTKFKIGSNLYLGGQSVLGGGGNSFHCNAIHYHEADDSYTIADRNPNLMVKATRTGSPVWQIGGSCSGAPAPKCAAGTWKVNHGHDFDKNGNVLLFNNGEDMMGGSGAHVLELEVIDSGSFSTSTVKDFDSGNSSGVLGDVQRLPNGNTLITYSSSGVMLEVDASWGTVQTLKGSFGYADWRETLYGPPSRI